MPKLSELTDVGYTDPVVASLPVEKPYPELQRVYVNEPVYSPGNIDLNTRPVVRNADGTISTVRSMSANFDGKEVLIPTVSDDGKILSAEDAIKQYRKSGKHLGEFKTSEEATAYAEKLHNDQDKQ